MYEHPQNEIQKTENEISKLVQKLETLRSQSTPVPVANYTFQTLTGKVTLLDLFGGREKLLAIHNMGQGCRYCTLWADGFNGILHHLENAFSVVLLSKDTPEDQRKFSQSRGWRFRMASHGGQEYIREQSVLKGEGNMPGVVCYERKGSEIFRKNSSVFGPGDVFSPHWHLISLAGIGTGDWTAQYSYWKRPDQMDDGGKNVL